MTGEWKHAYLKFLALLSGWCYLFLWTENVPSLPRQTYSFLTILLEPLTVANSFQSRACYLYVCICLHIYLGFCCVSFSNADICAKSPSEVSHSFGLYWFSGLFPKGRSLAMTCSIWRRKRGFLGHAGQSCCSNHLSTVLSYSFMYKDLCLLFLLHTMSGMLKYRMVICFNFVQFNFVVLFVFLPGTMYVYIHMYVTCI